MSYVDIVTSSFLGVTSQMVGFLTSRKHYIISFFADDESDYAFVFHKESTSADETMLTKREHESELRKHGKKDRQFHADAETY